MSKITPGGNADRDGRLNVGDRIISVRFYQCELWQSYLL